MSIIGIDIGSSTIKLVEYDIINEKILNKQISESKEYNKQLDLFINENNIDINKIEKIVVTGINFNKIDVSKYANIYFVSEFDAISKFGLSIANKDRVLIASVGTGTAFVDAVKGKTATHLGGTGVGAGTLTALCSRLANTMSFNEILELSQKGDISKIDLRIGDMTDEDIPTLPKDLTLSNFAKNDKEATIEDLVLGVTNMVAEVIGMMFAFVCVNRGIKDVVAIGNITCIPRIKDVFERIGQMYGLSVTIPNKSEFGVVIGAIKKAEEEK